MPCHAPLLRGSHSPSAASPHQNLRRLCAASARSLSIGGGSGDAGAEPVKPPVPSSGGAASWLRSLRSLDLQLAEALRRPALSTADASWLVGALCDDGRVSDAEHVTSRAASRGARPSTPAAPLHALTRPHRAQARR